MDRSAPAGDSDSNACALDGACECTLEIDGEEWTTSEVTAPEAA